MQGLRGSVGVSAIPSIAHPVPCLLEANQRHLPWALQRFSGRVALQNLTLSRPRHGTRGLAAKFDLARPLWGVVDSR